MRYFFRLHVFSAVIGTIFSVAAPAHAGWFNLFGGNETDQPPQSLILGEKGAKLESVPVPPPLTSPPTTKSPSYFSESPAAVDPPPPTSRVPMGQMPPAVDPDSIEASPRYAPPNSDGSFCPPLWTFRGGALFLHRSRAAADPIFFSGPGATPIGANTLGLGTTAGYDLGLTRRLGECYDIDFRFFGLTGWNGSAAFPADVVATNALGYPFANAAAPVALSYGANLFSNEVNLRRWFNDSWAITGGARWFESAENFVGSVPGIGNFATSNTSNHLFGAQIGMVWRHDFERWSLQANGNTGIYENFASAYVTSPPNVDAARYTHDRVAFASDFALIGAYKISNHFAVRVGYQFLWIDSIATAPNQLNTINLPTRTGTLDFGHTYYHGALVGFDFTW